MGTGQWPLAIGYIQGSAAGEVQRAEFVVPCDMRKSLTIDFLVRF